MYLAWTQSSDVIVGSPKILVTNAQYGTPAPGGAELDRRSALLFAHLAGDRELHANLRAAGYGP